MAVRRPDLFPPGVFGSGLFPTLPSSPGVAGEIDLRAELDEFFFGYQSGIRHGWPVVIRHMRRDANGRPIACVCRQDKTREGDPDCSYCEGERYLWDEGWSWTYSTYVGGTDGLTNKIKYMPPGAIRVDFRTFYFRYDTDIKHGDKIVEMRLDEEGGLVVPYVREAIYSPQTIIKHRSDNSRIEYITAHCREEDAIRPDNF
jgi:hypothetical protein